MGKKEEAARLTLGLSSLESLIPISLGRQRKFDHSSVDLIHFSDFLKLLGSVFEDGDFLVDGEHCLLLIC